MLLYVQLMAVIINYDLYNIREWVILFVWIPLLTVPYIYTRKKVIYKAAVILCFMEGLLAVTHWLILKGPPTATSLFVLSNTNYDETKEFIQLKFTFRLLLLIPFLILFYWAVRKSPEVTPHPKRNLIICLVLVFSIVFIGENTVHGRLVRKGVPQATKALLSYFEEMKSFQRLNKRSVRKMHTTISENRNRQHVFVLILGESCNRNHLSLYGYHRETTPKLDKRNDLIIYRNAVAPYSNTIGAVLSAITESNLENKMPYDKGVSLIDVFHSAGFKTYWLSNQPPLGVWDSPIFNFAQTADEVLFVNSAGNSSFENTYAISYDDKVLSPFSKALNEEATDKFIVLHLMGSHSAYLKRYPPSFNIFKSDSDEKSKLINEYDNSVVYTDYILDSLFNLLHSYSAINTNSVCAAIYLADHGENVYDENGNAGHDYAGSLPKSNVEVPFVVWLSTTYKTENSEKLKDIIAHSNAPFVTDDLFHSVLDLNNIQCNCYSKQRSVFNAGFNFKRKRILEDGLDYDLK